MTSDYIYAKWRRHNVLCYRLLWTVFACIIIFIMASTIARAGLLAGRVSIITGASSGLGQAMAVEFAKQGSTIICADQTPTSNGNNGNKNQPTHEMICEKGGKAVFISTDVADENDMLKLIRVSANQFGRIDM